MPPLVSRWHRSFDLGAEAVAPPVARRVIINADDFGLSSAVNSAIELGYREGILQSASLMVGESSTDEAVEIACRYPGLSVGLHIALSDSCPVLPPDQIPDLVQSNGRFHDDEIHLNRLLPISKSARLQLRAEVAAQFSAFRSTGLICDHVNAHRNAHINPIIAACIFREAQREGVRTVRIPWEPSLSNIRVHKKRSILRKSVRWARKTVMHNLARRYGMRACDQSFDMTGRGDELVYLLATLPAGTTEFYLHPGLTNVFDGCVPGLSYESDLRALLNPKVRAASVGIRIGGYREVLQQ